MVWLVQFLWLPWQVWLAQFALAAWWLTDRLAAGVALAGPRAACLAWLHSLTGPAELVGLAWLIYMPGQSGGLAFLIWLARLADPAGPASWSAWFGQIILLNPAT